jgi:hypothetical protein
MIPKRIYTAWVGPKPYPDYPFLHTWDILRANGYEIIELDNRDIVHSPFVDAMIGVCQWGAVADYMRMFYVYRTGGIMMDIDVEVLKPFDEYLVEAFCSSEIPRMYGDRTWKANPAISGAERMHPFYKFILDHFDASAELILSPDAATLAIESGIPMRVIDSQVFCPEVPDDKSCCIHHFKGEWTG